MSRRLLMRGSPPNPSLAPVGARWLALAATRGLLLASLAARAATEETAAPPEPTIPLFEVRDSPLGDAVGFLAKIGHLNVLIDPELTEPSRAGGQPPAMQQSVRARYENIPARAALEKLASDHGLRWVWRAETRLGRVTTPAEGEAATRMAADPAGMLPRESAATNCLALLAEEEAPLLDLLGRLATETKLNWTFGPDLAQGWSATNVPPPGSLKVSLRLENLTALDALAAVAENARLALVWNRRAAIGRVTSRRQRQWELAHPLEPTPDPPLKEAGRTPMPLVFIDDVSLEEAVRAFAEQTSLRVLLAPGLTELWRGERGGPNQGPMVSLKLKHATPFQALGALLDAQGLVLVWEPEAGVARVLSKAQRWEEQQHAPGAASALPGEVGSRAVCRRLSLRGLTLDGAASALGRLARLNLLAAPALSLTAWDESAPPTMPGPVWLELSGLTAREALMTLVHHEGLALRWDADTKVAQVAPRTAAITSLPPETRAAKTLLQGAADGGIQAVITLGDLPLNQALDALAKRAGLTLELDAALANGLVPPHGGKPAWPRVDVHFERVSAVQALAALLDNYRLAAVLDAPAKVLRLKAVAELR